MRLDAGFITFNHETPTQENRGPLIHNLKHTQIMKVHFDEIFSNDNGRITPKTTVFINGVTMGPGVYFGAGVSFGGVDLTTMVGKYLDIEQENGITVIKGHYS